MTLRKRTLVIIGGTVVVLMVILYVIARVVLLGSYEKLEEKHTRLNVQRALTFLSDDLANLNVTASDWAAWDDAYSFINGTYNDFIKINLVDSVFTTLKIDLMVFIDPSGRVVFGKAFDNQRKQGLPVPQSFQKHIADNSFLLQHRHPKSNVSGIILFPEGPMLISSWPIVTSEERGPIRGTLIFGRYLNAGEIQRLAEKIKLSLNIYRYDDPRMPYDFKSVKTSMTDAKQIFIKPLNAQTIRGYTLLNDVYGNPALILSIGMHRDIYGQGQESIYYFVLSLLVIGLALGGGTFFLLEEQVLSRLTKLIKNVSDVSTRGDLSVRMPITGKDELSQLSREINGMLEVIEKSDKALRYSEEKYRLIVENANETIAIAQEGRLKYVNPKAVQLIGYSQEELTSKAFLEFIHPED